MFYFYSDNRDLAVIDLSLNVFLYRKKYREVSPKFDEDILLESHWVADLERKIIEIQSENPGAMVGINMEYIHSWLDGRAFIEFGKDIPNKAGVFFYNILPNSDLQERLYSDLRVSGENVYFDETASVMYLVQPQGGDNTNCLDDCEKLINEHLARIVKKIVTRREHREMLSSSNIYTNHYVDVKRLFMQPENLNIILYYMAKRLAPKKLEYDAIVSTSKNGAVLSTLVGQLLNKDVVHCVNVGPQFALPIQAVEETFQKHKRYIYVCDFICLGTEVKLLHALMTSRQAIFVGGVGIANYIPLCNEDLKKAHSPLASVSCLVDLISAGIPYEIHIIKE